MGDDDDDDYGEEEEEVPNKSPWQRGARFSSVDFFITFRMNVEVYSHYTLLAQTRFVCGDSASLCQVGLKQTSK